jgi:hypothetical protein
MSTAEWNVLGLALTLIGLLTLFQYGMPAAAKPTAMRSWIGIALLLAGTACQMWANIRWVG